MKYKYFLTALQCNRWYSSFMRACDLGIDEVGVNKEISFVTDKKPTKQNIKQIEKLLESTKEQKSLECYFTNVKFNRAEIVMESDEKAST